MADALRWWAVLSLLGWAAAPLAAALLGFTPDRGYSAARVLGLLLAAYAYWLSLVLGASPGTALVLGPVALAVGSAAAVIIRLRLRYTRLLPPVKSVIATEAVFAPTLLGGVLLRAHMPDITGTEKPMEYMYLQASYTASTMPPPDLWMSGQRANYYYFGYVIHAFTAKLAGVPPAVAFNLGIATVLGLTVVTIMGAARAVLSRAGAASWVCGGLAALLVAAVASPAGSIEWLSSLRADRPIDWFWAPTRVVLDNIPGRTGPQATINEFPAFSFLLGDLHPHLMSMPLVALGLTTAAALAHPEGNSRIGPGLIGLCALLIATLYMTNTWDVPVLASLLLLAAVLGRVRRGRSPRPVLVGGAAAVVLAVILAAPFLSGYDAPVTSGSYLPEQFRNIPIVSTLGHYVGVVWWDHTSGLEFVRVWGLHAALFALAIPLWLRSAGRRALLPVLVTLALALALALPLRAPVLLLVPIVVLSLFGSVSASSPSMALALLFGAVGWGLVLVPELVYLRDAFEDRMNTTFKFYFQAWQVLGVADAVLVWELFRAHWQRHVQRLRPIAAALLALLAAASLGYGYAGIAARSVPDPTLDGTRFLRAEEPSASAAVIWLQAHSGRDETVAEATGPPYSMYGRLATYSGRPTILGWANHEYQWRAGQPWAGAEIAARERDVAALYSAANRAAQRQVIRRYNVRYAYYGQLEREMQRTRGIPIQDPFAGWLRVAARYEDGTLYFAGPVSP